jgi:alpha-D-xyloside xylohydrolase
VLREHRGEGEAVVFARSATAGGQQFPVHWGGDCSSTFESMARACAAGCRWRCPGSASGATTSAASRAPRPGGVQALDRVRPAVLAQPAARQPAYRVPWLFDEEAVDVLRKFTKLKHR